MTRCRGVVTLTGAALLGSIAVVFMAGGAEPPPVEPSGEPLPAAPTVEYPSLEAARDTVEVILRRSVSPADTAIHFSRQEVQFQYWYAKATAPGWAIRVVVNDTTECPNTALENALLAAGWAPAYGYQTDGTDGGDMGFVTRRFFCLVEARWDGGDGTDTTYVPAPGCDVTVTCVPRRDDDALR